MSTNLSIEDFPGSKENLKKLLEGTLGQLDSEEREIIKYRFGLGTNFSHNDVETTEKFGITYKQLLKAENKTFKIFNKLNREKKANLTD